MTWHNIIPHTSSSFDLSSTPTQRSDKDTTEREEVMEEVRTRDILRTLVHSFPPEWWSMCRAIYIIWQVQKQKESLSEWTGRYIPNRVPNNTDWQKNKKMLLKHPEQCQWCTIRQKLELEEKGSRDREWYFPASLWFNLHIILCKFKFTYMLCK